MQSSLLRTASARLMFLSLFEYFQRIEYKLHVCSRFLIAIIGGYFFTAVSVSLLTLTLPFTKVDAVLMSVSLSVLIYSVVFIYAFSIKSLKIVWISILLTTIVQSILVAMIKGAL